MQNAPREHSAILWTFIKLPFVYKTTLLYIFEWPLRAGFTVYLYCLSFQFDLDLNVVSDLILFVDAHMAGVTATECGQKSVFMKQVHERSKSLNK